MPISINDVVVFSAGGAVGYLARTFIDHNLAKSRDAESRAAKDFNEAADIMADILRKERECPSPGSNIDFFAFRRVLSQRELTRFDKYVEEYEKAKNDAHVKHYDSSGDGFVVIGFGYFQDETPIISALDKLIAFTKM